MIRRFDIWRIERAKSRLIYALHDYARATGSSHALDCSLWLTIISAAELYDAGRTPIQKNEEQS